MTIPITYEPFHQLIVSLRNDGFSKEADLLHAMIHKVAWTTVSELMGELGLAVNKIKRMRCSGLSEESKKNMGAAIEMVKRVCPDFKE
jgi:hypothetical protein